MRGGILPWLGIGVLALAGMLLVLRHSEGTVGGVTNADFAALMSGVALLIVIGGSMFVSSRYPAGNALRHAVLWIGAMLVLVTVYSYRHEFAGMAQRVAGELVPGTPLASTDTLGRTVVTLRRDGFGHFSTRGRINGTPASFLIDTGASRLTLTPATAAAAGFDPGRLKFAVPVETANGSVFMARVTVGRLELGDLVFHDVGAFVAPPGGLSGNLLGVNVLDRLDSYTVQGDEMVLTGRV